MTPGTIFLLELFFIWSATKEKPHTKFTSLQSFLDNNHPWSGGHHDGQPWRDEKTTQVKHNSHSSWHISAVIRTLATLTLHYLRAPRPSTFQTFARRVGLHLFYRGY